MGSAVMAGGTLAVLAWAPGPEARPGQATVAPTMAFVTFVFFQAFSLFIVRHPTRSVFTREALENPSAFIATGAVVVRLILIAQLNALHGFSPPPISRPANGWPAQRSARPACGSSSS